MNNKAAKQLIQEQLAFLEDRAAKTRQTIEQLQQQLAGDEEAIRVRKEILEYKPAKK